MIAVSVPLVVGAAVVTAVPLVVEVVSLLSSVAVVVADRYRHRLY